MDSLLGFFYSNFQLCSLTLGWILYFFNLSFWTMQIYLNILVKKEWERSMEIQILIANIITWQPYLPPMNWLLLWIHIANIEKNIIGGTRIFFKMRLTWMILLIKRLFFDFRYDINCLWVTMPNASIREKAIDKLILIL